MPDRYCANMSKALYKTTLDEGMASKLSVEVFAVQSRSFKGKQLIKDEHRNNPDS